MKKTYLLTAPMLTAIILTLLSVFVMTLNRSVDMKIDQCLDSGGSFDYQSCQCDDKNSHELIVEHHCE